MFFKGYTRPETERHSWVVSLRPHASDDWKYGYDIQPDFVKRKASKLMRLHLGMSWRQAVDLVYARRRKAIDRVQARKRIAAARLIDPR